MPTPELDLHGTHWINTVGHCAGIVVFATLFLLLYRDARRTRFPLRWQPLAATLLALGWDLFLLLGIAVRHVKPTLANDFASVAFACLSFLPAVLLDLGLHAHLHWLRRTGYAVSLICSLLHLSEIVAEIPGVHGFSLALLSASFALLAFLAFFAQRRQPRASTAASLCLFLLSISFLHFRSSGDHLNFWSEIILHHAGIPVALYMVLEDYRFLLVDAFLRLLANGFLAGLFLATGFKLTQLFPPVPANSDNSFPYGIRLVAGALFLIAFSFLRNRLQSWLTRQVFLRRDPQDVLAALRNLSGDESTLLDQSIRLLATYFRASRHLLAPEPRPGYEATSTLHFLKGDELTLHLGGRRFLSEDLALLDDFTSHIAREVDRVRTLELERLVSQAELRALQSQIHPHFLFNALNALYGSIPRAQTEARRLVLSLSEVFRYFLTTSKSMVPFAEELTIVEAYLDIERARLGPRLETHIQVPEEVRSFLIPVLSVQPLVENAVQHGVAAQSGPGRIHLTARAVGQELIVTIEDSGPGLDQPAKSSSNRVGLDNVRRRLALHYGPAASLELTSLFPGVRATLRLPAQLQNPPANSPANAVRGNLFENESGTSEAQNSTGI